MSSGSFLYILKDALVNLKNNRVMSIASVGILTSCLVMLGSAMLLVGNINSFLSKVEKSNEIVVFIDENADEDAVEELKKDILKLKNVDSVRFVSKEEALEDFKKNYSQWAEGLGEDNPLRSYYVVKIKDINYFSQTVYALEHLENVAHIRQKLEVVQSLVHIRRALTVLSVSVIGLLLLVSLFIISNTVKLAMFTRKLEINIMKFVGATDWFIRLPFMLEGIIIGLVSFVLSYFLQQAIYTNFLTPVLEKLSFFKPVPFDEFSGFIALAFLAFAVISGVLGSLLPMRKYLRV